METSIDDNEKYLISAWLDDILFEGERKIPELVIALFLTKETVDKAMSLVVLWISEDLTNERINGIIVNNR
jgi:hypothetical protein